MKMKASTLFLFLTLMVSACGPGNQEMDEAAKEAKTSGENHTEETKNDMKTEEKKSGSESTEPGGTSGGEEDAGSKKEGTSQDNEPETQVNEATEADEQKDGKGDRPQEKQVPYNKGKNIAEEKGTLTKNSSGNYSLYVMDGYKLAAEEPGLDMLMNENNGKNYMQIVMLPAEDKPDWNAIEKNSIEQLKSVDSKVEERTWTLPDEMLEGAKMYQAKSKDIYALTVLVQESSQYPAMTLTIYSEENGIEVEKMLGMAKTIQVEKLN